MQTIASPAIKELAAQLLRGPARLRLKQLRSIDFLLSVVESGRAYPADFVRTALTGYRPTAVQTDGRDTVLVEGDQLVADLVALAERLSENADIHVETWPEDHCSINELAERFDVSTKTIFRWRRRGLVGWKFRYPDRRMRVAFPERCVRQFVAQHADLVQRGSSFSQLTKAERQRIIDRAKALVESGETTINAVGRTISNETGRAIETIRLILKSYDDANPGAGLFNRSRLEVAIDDQRLAVWEAYVDGVRMPALAARFERPVGWIYRIVTEMRARDLRSRKIEYVPSDEFESEDADARILGSDDLRQPYRADAKATPRVPKDLPPYLQQLFLTPLLSREGEAALFRKMNYLKFKADRERQTLEPETVKARELDGIEQLLYEAEEVKKQLTQANLRLVVSIAKKHMGPDLDFFEIISDGNMSLMRAVEKFDYSRGFKFSTYASWAIMRNYARLIPEKRRHHDRYQTGRDELLTAAPGAEVDEHTEEQVVAVRGVLERMLGTLPEREQAILRLRYGLDDYGEARTLEQIGRDFGVSKERIRQLESRAMEKLRTDFESDVEQLLGA